MTTNLVLDRGGVGAAGSGYYSVPMSVLDDIVAGVREDLAERESALPLDAVKALAAKAPPPRDAIAALSADGVAVIAEVKRSSPSAGDLAMNSARWMFSIATRLMKSWCDS